MWQHVLEGSITLSLIHTYSDHGKIIPVHLVDFGVKERVDRVLDNFVVDPLTTGRKAVSDTLIATHLFPRKRYLANIHPRRHLPRTGIHEYASFCHGVQSFLDRRVLQRMQLTKVTIPLSI